MVALLEDKVKRVMMWKENPPAYLREWRKERKERDTFLEKLTELEACARSPEYFLTNYAYIQNRNTGQKIKWEPWDFHLDLLRDFALYKELVILKARQNGITWLGAGYCLGRAMFGENVLVLYLSQGEDEACEMVRKSRFIWENLPDFLRLSLKNDQKSYFSFAVNNSEIRALPSTINAGRGMDATIVWRDELARHEYARENFAAIGPAIDAGGQLIDVSTIKKLDPTNHFTERVNKARSGESNAHFIFLGWRSRPVRAEGMTQDEWFNSRIKPKYSAFEIEQEYPETLEDVLRVSKVQAYIDGQILDNMLLDCCEPLDMGGAFDTLNGMIKIYKLPVPGRKYCIFTDPSDGVRDPHATIIIDWQTEEHVAESHGLVPVELCAEIHDRLVRFYNKNAFNSYEVNLHFGGRFQEILKALDTPNIAPRRKPEGEIISDKWGFYTTEQHRRLLMAGLLDAVRTQRVRVHNKEIISELRTMIRDETDTPRAMKGCHDDYVMALAGALYIRKYMPTHEAKVISVHYKQRWG